MASNHFGNLFRITTWGESHGRAIGVVIDGCPAGLPFTEEELHRELFYRSPGNSPFTSPRKEEDRAEIYSGIFEGKTTGAPISIIIPNKDARPESYEPMKNLLRPGHASYPYRAKYGIFDHKGSGRASARETACRVAAGAVAKKLLMEYGVEVVAFLAQVGDIKAFEPEHKEVDSLREEVLQSPIFCPDKEAEREIMAAIKAAQDADDSVGGIVELRAEGIPPGLGEPVYDKLEATLSRAMMSIPACKGIEIGSGFSAAHMRGSEHNDLYDTNVEGHLITTTNHAGGILGGISTGMPLLLRCAFKPPSSIKQKQTTVTIDGKKTEFTLPEGSRHDPCVAIRAVPVVEAMAALTLADALLMHRSARLFQEQMIPS